MRFSCILTLWIAALLAFVAAPAAADVLVNKSFSPANINPAQTSTLTIRVINNTTTVATSVNVTDNLPVSPTGMRIAAGGVLANTCGGTVTATAGATSTSLVGGTVPAGVDGTAGECAFSVRVTATVVPSGTSTNYINTINPATVSSSIGSAAAPASATLSVAGLLNLTGTIVFTPNVMHADGPPNRMRVTLSNPNTYAVTSLSIPITLQASFRLAILPNAVSTCGGTLTANSSATTYSVSGGTIAAGGSCYVEVDIIARNPGNAFSGAVTNSAGAGTITTAQGATNILINGSLTNQTGTALTKTFSPATIAPGATSTLVLTITNYRAILLSGLNLTDSLPAGLTVNGPTSTTCGGTASQTSTSITLSGGSLAASPTATVGGTSCTITTTVTAASSGSYINTIPAGLFGTTQYPTASATLTASAVSGSKLFAPISTPQSGVSTLTITLNNASASAGTITSFTDSLASMGTGFTVAASPAATTSCPGSSLSATPGSTSVSLSGGTIPSNGTCTIVVPVQVAAGAATAARVNMVAAGALQTSNGANAAAFTATLTVHGGLSVSTAFLPTSVPAGGRTRLTVTLKHEVGASIVTNTSLTDTLPAGFVIASSPNPTTTCTSGTVVATPGASTFSLSGASIGTSTAFAATCTFSADVIASTTIGSYTNTIPIGAVSANTPYGVLTNQNVANAAITVVPSVTLNKAFSPTSIAAGATSRLTVYISNPAAAGALTGVALTDSLPPGMIVGAIPNATLVATTGTCSGVVGAAAGGNSVSLSGGAISAGAACELSVNVTSPGIGALTNTLLAGIVTSTQGYSNANIASATLVSSGNADVGVTKTDAVAQVTAGGMTTYTLVVRNYSTALTVTNLPVNDPQPAGMTFTSWSCSADTGSLCGAANGTGPIATTASLAINGTVTYTVNARIAASVAGASITNIATLNPSAIGALDPNSANDSASDTDEIIRIADLAIVKSSTSGSPQIGNTVDFTLTVTNIGPSDAAGAITTDVLPSGYAFVSATPSTGTFAAPTWTIGAVAVGTPATLVIRTTVQPSGVYMNAATVTATTLDPVMSNNTSSITPVVTGLALAKSIVLISDPYNGLANPKSIPGAVLQYSLKLTNAAAGGISTSSIVIGDAISTKLQTYVLAGGVTFIDGSPSTGLTFDQSRDVTWSNAVGGGAPFTYTPTPDAAGFDSSVTGIRINPKGQINAGTQSAPATATFAFRVKVK